MSFSERYGHKPVKNTFQIDSMDEPLRNALWSMLKIYYWDGVRVDTGLYGGYYLSSYGNEKIKMLCTRLWLNYFKLPLDNLGNDWDKVLDYIRQYYFSCKWNEVYDFIEFVANNFNSDDVNEKFMRSCNTYLEKELSAYRFVNGIITKITDAVEIADIEQAANESQSPVTKHLQRSLELLSDRKTPDYRNSVKESISAVESFAKIVLKDEKPTLGQLLKKLEDEAHLHPAMKTAFSNLYGYSSDEGGIRHALTEVERVDFDDAKFMLVVCSAFINYVQGKNKK